MLFHEIYIFATYPFSFSDPWNSPALMQFLPLNPRCKRVHPYH